MSGPVVGGYIARVGILVLLRHGQASVGTSNYDRLSDNGRRQARLAGARLAAADLRFDRVIAGALTRQRDTATEVMTELRLDERDLQLDDRLDEYDHLGMMDRQNSAVSFETATSASSGRALQSALDEAIARWIAGEGGHYRENHADFLGRVIASVRELAALPGSTLAVTSGGVIAAVCAQLTGMPSDGWPALAKVTVNASITKLIVGRSGVNLLTFNDHAHLEHDRALVTYR